MKIACICGVLVGLGFPENVEDSVNIQFPGLTEPFHLDGLREGGGAILTLHTTFMVIDWKAYYFSLRAKRKLMQV